MAKKKNDADEVSEVISSERLGEDLVSVRVRVEYEDDEIAAMGRDASSMALEIERAEEEKRAAVSDFNARIKAMRAKHLNLCERCERGFDIREVECVVVVPDDRDPKVKVFKDRRTGEVIGEEPFAPGEIVQPDLAVSTVDIPDEKPKRSSKKKAAKKKRASRRGAR